MIVKSRCLEFEGYCKRCCLLGKLCVKRLSNFCYDCSSCEIDTRALGVGFNADDHDLLILLQRKCSDIQYRHNHIFKIHKCSEISHFD